MGGKGAPKDIKVCSASDACCPTPTFEPSMKLLSVDPDNCVIFIYIISWCEIVCYLIGMLGSVFDCELPPSLLTKLFNRTCLSAAPQTYHCIIFLLQRLLQRDAAGHLALVFRVTRAKQDLSLVHSHHP